MTEEKLTFLVQGIQRALGDLTASMGMEVSFRKENASAVVSQTVPRETILVSVGFTGDAKGGVSFAFRKSTFALIVRGLSGGMISDMDSDMAISCIGEFANMTVGNFATNLAGRNVFVNITPPQVFKGISVRPTFGATAKNLHLPYMVDNHPLDVAIFLCLAA